MGEFKFKHLHLSTKISCTLIERLSSLPEMQVELAKSRRRGKLALRYTYVCEVQDDAANFRLQLFTKAETFEKCPILFKFKKDENFNRRHTSSISRIEI